MENIDYLLRDIENASRYIGGEINSYNKKVNDNMVRFALAFPDIYEIGMSYLGFQILYNLKNEREDIFCERVFSPWIDLEDNLRKTNTELFTLESKTPLKEMDFIGFTLQYELSYTNILNMLDLSNIPFKSKDRDDSYPLILAGGPNAYNPEPLAEIIDLFIIGEGEEVNIEVIELYKKMKKENFDKNKFLYEVSKIEGVYVPSLYKVEYNDDNTIKSFKPINNDVKKKVKKRIIKNYDKSYYPEKIIVPFQDVVHNRAMIEIFRGCSRGCRFCQAGMIYRPVRERSKEDILNIAKNLKENTGFEEFSVSALSSLDHSEIESVIKEFISKYEKEKIDISLPSLRLDSKSIDLLTDVQKLRKTSLTFAPEAGSQRLRNVINKGVTKNDFENTLKKVFENGWKKIKLYFMIGLPTETIEDVLKIADLSKKAIDLFYDIPKDKRNGWPSITTSASNFVPKPFTPFQWVSQDSIEDLNKKHQKLNSKINDRNIKFNYHGTYESTIEGIIARGDRRLNDVLIKAFELGCKFDSWGKFFDYEKWQIALKELDFDPKFYNERKRDFDEILPWDHIDCGVSKEFLKKEYLKALDEKTTKECRENCSNCGVNIEILGGECY
ncbi:MAG: TIGR03960 family B12-binding radical SAM protein [Bacillota bacterium]